MAEQRPLIFREGSRTCEQASSLIPAAIFAMLLGIVVFLAMIVSFFAVLFTGRWPEGVRTFLVGSSRYFVRLSAYAYLLTDEYPPFSLDGDDAAPARTPLPAPAG